MEAELAPLDAATPHTAVIAAVNSNKHILEQRMAAMTKGPIDTPKIPPAPVVTPEEQKYFDALIAAGH